VDRQLYIDAIRGRACPMHMWQVLEAQHSGRGCGTRTDGLTNPWFGFVWMNPPFGGRNGLEPWLARFFAHGNGIALTPDRTSAPWFRRAAAAADAVLFMPNLKFGNARWLDRVRHSKAGSALIGPRARAKLATDAGSDARSTSTMSG
jgi:hypothetical protein